MKNLTKGVSMYRHALRTVFASLFALGLLAGIAPAGAQTTSPAPVTTGTPEEKAAAITGPSVVYIEQYWTAWVRVPKGSGLYFTGYVNDGQAFEWGTRCSGFIVNPTGSIVTAGHCVDDSEEGARETALAYATQWLIDNGWAYKKDFQYWLDEGHLMWKVEGEEASSPPDLEVYVQHGIAQGGVKSGDSFPARVVDSQPWSEGDVALLKIEESDLPALLLAPDADIDIGTPVLSVGYPGSTDQVTDQSLEPTYKDGQINAKKTREGGLLPVYEMSAALSGGMSGGPTVNLQGNVVGVNSFGIVGETEAFNFITPSSSSMMARTASRTSSADRRCPRGARRFYQGDYRRRS
jgi:S1-C subfamily serine protease